MALNSFDKRFKTIHNHHVKFQGALIDYYYDDSAYISDIPVIVGNKSVPIEQDDGLIVQYKTVTFAFDGELLRQQDTSQTLITPRREHYIMWDGIKYELINLNGAYFLSSLPTNAQSGLITVYTSQASKTQH